MKPSENPSHPSRRGLSKSGRNRAYLLIGGVFLFGLVCGIGITSFIIPNQLVRMIQEQSGVDFLVQRFQKQMLDDLELDPEQEDQVRLELERFRQGMNAIRSETTPKFIHLLEDQLSRIEAVLNEDQAGEFREKSQRYVDRIEQINMR